MAIGTLCSGMSAEEREFCLRMIVADLLPIRVIVAICASRELSLMRLVLPVAGDARSFDFPLFLGVA